MLEGPFLGVHEVSSQVFPWREQFIIAATISTHGLVTGLNKLCSCLFHSTENYVFEVGQSLW